MCHNMRRLLMALLIFFISLTTAVPAFSASVTISAVGDITIGGDPRKGENDIGSEKFYERLYKGCSGGFLKKVRGSLRGITIANLETTFTTGRVYRKKSYIFRAKPAYARVLAVGGIDVVTHANNHSGDFSGGVKSTRAAVKSQKIAYAGNGYAVTGKYNGIKIGVCAINAVGSIGESVITSAVRKLKKKCHIVIVSIHWGSEYNYNTSSTQRRLGHAAINAGASLVLGHHSHVVGEIEKYKGRYIVYSLGTFSSPILTPKDMDTFIFSQTFQVNKSGAVTAGAPRIIPCRMSSRTNVNDGKPVVLSGSERKRVLEKIRSIG